MSENTDEPLAALERRSRALFADSVEGMDMPTRSRLTQARHAALDGAARARGRRVAFVLTKWTPAAGVAAAVLLGVVLWMGSPLHNHGVPGEQANLEDLDIVASSDGNSGDALEMLQDDLDFYDFAEKAPSLDPAA